MQLENILSSFRFQSIFQSQRNSSICLNDRKILSSFRKTECSCFSFVKPVNKHSFIFRDIVFFLNYVQTFNHTMFSLLVFNFQKVLILSFVRNIFADNIERKILFFFLYYRIRILQVQMIMYFCVRQSAKRLFLMLYFILLYKIILYGNISMNKISVI